MTQAVAGALCMVWFQWVRAVVGLAWGLAIQKCNLNAQSPLRAQLCRNKNVRTWMLERSCVTPKTIITTTLGVITPHKHKDEHTCGLMATIVHAIVVMGA